MAGSDDITRLLGALRAGDAQAGDALMARLYDELRALAHRQRGRHKPYDTLNTTALIHEAYLKLIHGSDASFENRTHFMAVAARAMRQILVDYARQRRAQKRGGGAHHTLIDKLGDGHDIAIDEQADAVIHLDDALTRLAELDERAARVAELRFFAGLSVEETAEALEISPTTVKRSARAARAFLYDALSEGE